jgi:predicted nuclease of predicted toxin-antitoxin system
VKLLFDANLSPRLVSSVLDLFPDSTHVWNVGVGPDDEAIWTFARDNDLTIISKDSDFYRLSVLRGAPPKVAWLRVGNAGTTSIAATIRTRAKDLRDFAADATAALLMLGRP